MMKSPNNKCSLKNANEEIFKKICYFQITEVFRILEKKKQKLPECVYSFRSTDLEKYWNDRLFTTHLTKCKNSINA